MADRVVLDTGPVLAYLQDEPGADEVGRLLLSGGVWMNLVNLGEVTYVVERREGPEAADDVFAELTSEEPPSGGPPLSWVPVDVRLARQAAHIKAAGGISYADSFAAACADQLDCEVVALRDDEEFKVAEKLGIRVRWIP